MPRLDELPLVVLDLICDFLRIAPFDQRQSLSAFSLASQKCRIASEGSRLYQISVVTRGPSRVDVQRAVDETESRLLGRFHHVRRLNVVTRQRLYSGRTDPVGGFSLLEAEDIIDPEPVNGGYDYNDVETQPDFDPLVDLIHKMPALADLMWFLSSQIPVSLVSSSSTLGPRYRLHVCGFRLESLMTPFTQEYQGVDAEEYAIITSPSLYTARCANLFYFEDDDNGKWNYNIEAIMHILGTPSCKIRRLAVNLHQPGGSIATVNALSGRYQRPRWPGFFPPSAQEPEQASVTKQQLWALDLNAGHIVNSRFFSEWDEIIDFSTLTCLDVGDLHSEVIPTLASMARRGTFNPLQKFKIGDVLLKEDEIEVSNTWKEDVSHLLEALPPLRVLYIEKTESQHVFDAIVEIHGPELRELGFNEPAIFTGQNAYRLSKSCIRLRTLNVTLRRSCGDEKEVALYHAFGLMRQLMSVNITYDCKRSDITGLLEQGEFVFKKYDRDASLAHVQDALINLAIDENLARSIFTAIARTQKRAVDRLGIHQFMFQHLRIECPDYALFGQGYWEFHSEMEELLDWLRGSWICESSLGLRDPNAIFDDRENGVGPDGIVAQDLNVSHRAAREEDQPELLDYVDQVVEDAWMGLWPCDNRDDWKSSWRGQPLAEIPI